MKLVEYYRVDLKGLSGGRRLKSAQSVGTKDSPFAHENTAVVLSPDKKTAVVRVHWEGVRNTNKKSADWGAYALPKEASSFSGSKGVEGITKEEAQDLVATWE